MTTARITLIADWVCATLGLVSVLLNAFVVIVLSMNKKLIMENVFYLLVLHCAIVGSIQALALIGWCLPSLRLFSTDILIKLTMMKQWIVMVLGCLNMLTVLNLLLFTVNEYIVVKKPLFYRRLSRRLVAVFILLSWFLSFSFGMGNVLTKHFSPGVQSVFVPENYGIPSTYGFISEMNDSRRNSVHLFYTNSNFVTHSYSIPKQYIPSRERAGEDFHFPFLFATIVVCISCLVIVVSCYALILKRVRRFHRDDFRFGSETSRSVNGPGGSRRQSQNSFTLPLTTINTTRQSMSSGRKLYRRCTSLSRHKYLLVIGTVLFIDVLFIVPYSTIQLLKYLYFSGYKFASAYWWTQPRWILHLLIGCHSVLQPLCYFRMKEFRRMATCRKVQVSSH